MRLAAEQPRQARSQKVMQRRPQQQRAAEVNIGRNTDPHLPRAHGEATAAHASDGEHERARAREDHGEDRR